MFPKKDPGRGEEKTVTWQIENFKERSAAAGWLQDYPTWLDAHHYFVTVPCHDFLSGGKLRCPWCTKGRPREEVAYVPWIDESGKPYCTTFKKYSRPVLAKIKPFDPIALGKGGKKFDPVWIKPRSGSYRWVPSPGTERTEEQFQRWLLRLWKSPELVEFFASDNGLSQPTAPAAAPDPGRQGRAPTLVTPTQEIEFVRREPPVRPAGGDGGGLRLVGEALPPPPVPNGKHPKKP